ncbi:RNA polymerase sigma factor [Puia dinghuensis]|uniref:DNA-directed RNA polymerase sigma-70 factor n=1 Tax=Puia dinghuensis TaxID=1792502 RepID=A0A8J2UGJ8_9BACT|nr:sigma-70 family RNA polymerase sigma factor [Puia dinghuensis]GGB12999.1 DNA-directed RNA polymerase sigma-70 factor [Puia dinghuensis]
MKATPGNSPQQLVDHLFRHEAGKMIAVLTRIFGIQNLELVEDTVQETFLKALQVWKFGALPDNPSAWLMRVARNRTIDLIRRQQKLANISAELSKRLQSDTEIAIEQFFLDTEIADSQLRMIFTCCHPGLNQEDQVALTLKSVSGFGVQEIAKALVSTESAIQKRLYRAKESISKHDIQFEIPTGLALNHRLETVYTVLYLLFNEGYNSSKADELIRYDLCAEAMRLCKLLTEHKMTAQPAGFALMSLMCFQASRFGSRLGEDNTIILLQQQDRRKWDQQLIKMGYHFLISSSTGDVLSVYHIESAIAAEHCLAPDFESTNWELMLRLYDLLLEQKPIPIVKLNRAIILAQTAGVAAAVDAILDIPGIAGLLEQHYIYAAVLGDLYGRAGNLPEARRLLEKAWLLTPSLAEKKLLQEKMAIFA